MSEKLSTKIPSIENCILILREKQVMLDKDLAIFYQTETRSIKQAVKRNINRFPEDFIFEINNVEADLLVSQNVIPNKSHLGGALPFAFTEQGVAMLASVLKTKTAVDISIRLIRTFVALRKINNQYSVLFNRIEFVEKKQIEHDNHFNKIFSALEKRDTIPDQGIFFNGQIFDAYKFVADIIKSATTSIILIDNYIDETTLALLSKRNTETKAIIYSEHLSRNQIIDLQKLNAQYETIEIRKLKHNHDRFLIIDEKEMYHFGASLKDLGKKIFAFSKMDNEVGLMLGRVHAGLDG